MFDFVMNIERKLVDALERNDLIKIEKLFNDIYNSNYKLVYFCVANLIKNKEDLELVKVQMFNLYNLFFDEITNLGAVKIRIRSLLTALEQKRGH